MLSLPKASALRTAIIVTLIALGVILGIGATVSLLTGRSVDSNNVRWPDQASSAVAVDDSVMHGPGAGQRRPMGSIAKIVTALVVLDRVPIAQGDSGPTYPMTDWDAQVRIQQQALGLQTAPVRIGEELSLRDLLTGTLVLSSNNHTLSLVSRVFGDESAYVQAAKDWLSSKGLRDIEIADATGASPESQASPDALVALGRLADADPVIREIVRRAVVVDGIDLLNGTNDLLGAAGIDGMKTGSTDAAGYCVLFTAPLDAENPDDPRRIIGVILGAPSQAQRASDAVRLLGSVRAKQG